jgi:hypothetical protein
MDRRPLAAAALLALLAASALAPATALASSHSEAPGTSKDRLADDTDLYAWVAADAPDAVTIVGNWVPLIEPNSGPNFAGFDDNAHYYINVDNVGDAHKHIRFEFTFNTTRQNQGTFLYNTGVVTSLNDPDLNVRQTWTLTRVDEDAHTETVIGTGQVAPYFVGPVSMPVLRRPRRRVRSPEHPQAAGEQGQGRGRRRWLQRHERRDADPEAPADQGRHGPRPRPREQHPRHLGHGRAVEEPDHQR